MLCIDCKHNDIIRDNHDELHAICTCAESENFLKGISFAWSECDFGEKEQEESEEED